MRNRKIRIEKIGTSTVVTTYPEGYPPETHPDLCQVHRYDGNYRVYASNDVITVEAISPDLVFPISELEDNFGLTDVEQIIDKFSELYYFVEGAAPDAPDPDTDQDNIRIVKLARILPGPLTVQNILAAVNNLPFYTVTPKQLVIFDLFHEDENKILWRYAYLMTYTGKGNYGTGGIALTINNLFLVERTKPTLAQIIAQASTQFINYGAINTTIPQWTNIQSPSLTIQPQTDGQVIFDGTINGVPRSFLWVGTAGNYGLGNDQSTQFDFRPFNVDGTLTAGFIYKKLVICDGHTNSWIWPMDYQLISLVQQRMLHLEEQQGDLHYDDSDPGRIFVDYPCNENDELFFTFLIP